MNSSERSTPGITKKKKQEILTQQVWKNKKQQSSKSSIDFADRMTETFQLNRISKQNVIPSCQSSRLIFIGAYYFCSGRRNQKVIRNNAVSRCREDFFYMAIENTAIAIGQGEIKCRSKSR